MSVPYVRSTSCPSFSPKDPVLSLSFYHCRMSLPSDHWFTALDFTSGRLRTLRSTSIDTSSPPIIQQEGHHTGDLLGLGEAAQGDLREHRLTKRVTPSYPDRPKEKPSSKPPITGIKAFPRRKAAQTSTSTPSSSALPFTPACVSGAPSGQAVFPISVRTTVGFTALQRIPWGPSSTAR